MHHRALPMLVGTLLATTLSIAIAQPVPKVGTGRIERLADFPSRNVDSRHVDVWLPAGYGEGARADKRYNVLYMHDGQMLFDASTTWNKQAWNADAVVAKLVKEGRIPDTIIVGIWNNSQRYAEYYPEKALRLAPEAVRREYVEKAQNGKSQADAYLRFIVDELKPTIDARYATRSGPQGTFVLGSSMGGLISLYALCEYPQVFGGAAGLSTHWAGIPTAWGLDRVRNAALPLAAINYLNERLPPAGRHRIYTDRGDDALDSLYAPAHGLVTELLRDRGYTAGDSSARLFEGTGHNERDWGKRLEVPLVFLMGSSGKPRADAANGTGP